MDIVCILNSKQVSNLLSSRKSILLQAIQIFCASCENISIVMVINDVVVTLQFVTNNMFFILKNYESAMI